MPAQSATSKMVACRPGEAVSPPRRMPVCLQKEDVMMLPSARTHASNPFAPRAFPDDTHVHAATHSPNPSVQRARRGRSSVTRNSRAKNPDRVLGHVGPLSLLHIVTQEIRDMMKQFHRARGTPVLLSSSSSLDPPAPEGRFNVFKLLIQECVK